MREFRVRIIVLIMAQMLHSHSLHNVPTVCLEEAEDDDDDDDSFCGAVHVAGGSVGGC